MKTKAITRKSTVALVVAVATMAFLASMAAPAFAGEPMYVELIGYAEVFQPEEPEVLIGTFIPSLDLEPVIPDGGDWEMVPQDEPTFPDGGDDEGDVPDEPEIPDGGDDEGDVPDEPEIPDDGDDEPGLPFTGGNETPFVLLGLGICLAGVGVLVGRRHVFDK